MVVSQQPRKRKPSVQKLVDLVREPRYTGQFTHRVLIGTPTLGVVRIEWANALNGLVVPTNWSNSTQTPIGFRVDDAQNLIARDAIQQGFEWLLLIEDDVVVPADLLLKLLPYMEAKTTPIVSGLYHIKGNAAEPILYRGRGNGAYRDWKPGEKVWVDGVPTGCLLVHVSMLKALAARAETYVLRVNEGGIPVKRVFWTPRAAFSDPGLPSYQKLVGTSDLFFCDQIMQEGIFKAAGWPALARKEYPYLVDTSIRCGHIDRTTGQVF